MELSSMSQALFFQSACCFLSDTYKLLKLFTYTDNILFSLHSLINESFLAENIKK